MLARVLDAFDRGLPSLELSQQKNLTLSQMVTRFFGQNLIFKENVHSFICESLKYISHSKIQSFHFFGQDKREGWFSTSLSDNIITISNNGA